MNAEYYKKYEPFFGKWTLGRQLGAGSYGRVFEILRTDPLNGTVYHGAMKAITIPSSPEELQSLMEEDGLDHQGASTYFRQAVLALNQEIALMNKVKGHSNIVSYEDHDVIEHSDGIGWDILIRMELLTPISQYFKQFDTVPPREVVRLGIHLCRALEVCAKYNIIHRDIKPANIFLSDTGDYKLGDFGVARTASASAAASTFAGTVNYMAPEVFRREKYTASVDTYSLGLVMYQLLNANRMPFYPPYPQPMTALEKERAHDRRLAGEPLPPPVNADPQLAAVVLKACAPAPADRFADPTQMRRALEALSDAPAQPDAAGDATVRAAAPVQTPADGERTTRLFAGQTTPPQPAPAAAARTPQPAPDSNATLYLFAEQEKQRQEAERARRLQQEQERQQQEQERRLQFEQQEQQRQQQLNEKRRQAELARQQAQAQAEAARKAAAPAPAPAPAPVKTGEPTLSRRKMLGILGGAAALALVGGAGYAVYSSASSAASESVAASSAASKPVDKNSCGDGLTWNISDAGVLTIRGSGTITGTPWTEFADRVTAIDLQASVPTIPPYCFTQFTSLTSVTLPEGLQTIGSYSFYCCVSLTFVSVPDGVTAIGNYAFGNCNSLSSVSIPDSVQKIYRGAFNHCSLTSVTLSRDCVCETDAFGAGVTIHHYS